jgi:hypothetical protein
VFAHALIRGAEFDSVDGLGRYLKARRRQVGTTGSYSVVNLRVASDRRDFQAHAQLIREAARQLVFRAFRHIVRAAIKCQRPISRNDTQFPEGLDLIDQAR